MTVCIATDVYFPQIGGIAGYYKYLSDLLTAAGHTVIVLTIDEKAYPESPDSICKEDTLIKVILRTTYAKHRNYYSRFFRPGSYGAPGWMAMGMAMNEWLKQNHKKYKIDIIEIGDYGGSGIFLADNDLPPVMVIGHSSATQLAKYNYMIDDDHAAVIQKMELLSFEHCDAITSHSIMNCKELKKISGREVHFTRAPWIPPVIPQWPNDYNSGCNLVISGLQITKGAAVMAEATRLINKENKSWKIYWTGGDTYSAPGGKKVSSYLRKNYPDIWNKNFIWTDKKDHQSVMEEIMSAGVAVIPSVWETFNYFSIEAAYLQKPLIITENTGAAYLFEKDRNVITIPSGSAAILAETLLQQCTDKWKKSITMETKDMLLEYFSAENIIAERMKVYYSVIKNRQPHHQHLSNSLEFIRQYTTPARKLYYSVRRTAKRLIKGQ